MSKIKWNDDRIKQTLTAVLLISRSKLHRGGSENLIEEALADFRNDPAGYKAEHWNKVKSAWSDPKDLSSLKTAGQVACYRALLTEVDTLAARLKRNQIQFSSVIELDKYLVTYLKAPQC
jgi:hypothetical protein